MIDESNSGSAQKRLLVHYPAKEAVINDIKASTKQYKGC